MENKDVKKWSMTFNFCKWAFIVVAILSFMSIINALITNEVSVFSFVCKSVEVIIFSLVLAFISSRTTVIPRNEE